MHLPPLAFSLLLAGQRPLGRLGRWMLEAGKELDKRQAASSKNWQLSNEAFHPNKTPSSLFLTWLLSYFWNEYKE